MQMQQLWAGVRLRTRVQGNEGKALSLEALRQLHRDCAHHVFRLATARSWPPLQDLDGTVTASLVVLHRSVCPLRRQLCWLAVTERLASAMIAIGAHHATTRHIKKLGHPA